MRLSLQWGALPGMSRGVDRAGAPGVWDACLRACVSGLARTQQGASTAEPLAESASLLPPHLSPHLSAEQRGTFSEGVLALAAGLMQVDGPLNQAEMRAFEHIFPLPGSDSERVHQLLRTAAAFDTPLTDILARMRAVYPGTGPLAPRLLDGLCRVAVADGDPTRAEWLWLLQLAAALGMAPTAAEAVLRRHCLPPAMDPYRVLGVPRQADIATIRQAYRRLIREYHPDGLAGHGLAESLVSLASDKIATINHAYDRIARQRGFK